MDITADLKETLKSIEVFCCYAREDEILLNQLKNHLQPLQRQGLIEFWYDREIRAGSEWEPEIKKKLDAAQIILLLVSPDFMASDYCYGIEMKRALERYDAGDAIVIPIILRDVFWHGKPLGRLQALPTDGKPVTSRVWGSQDEAFYTIVVGIRDAVEARLAEAEQQLRTEEVKQRQAEELEPHQAEEPEPRQAEELEPHQAEEPEPHQAEELEPHQAEEPEPRQAEEPEPHQAEEPEPRQVEESEPHLPPLPLHKTVLSARGKIIMTAVLLILVVSNGILLYTSVSNQITIGKALATAQSGDFYLGTHLVNDPMRSPGSAFDWTDGNDSLGNQCNFKNNAYHVSGICQANGIAAGKISFPLKFAFEIYLAAGHNCSFMDFSFFDGGPSSKGGIVDVNICQNGQYDLNNVVENSDASGSTPAMLTGADQSNLIAIIVEGNQTILSINHVYVASIFETYTGLLSLSLDGYSVNGGKAEVVYTNASLWSF